MPIVYRDRPRAKWLALGMVCALAIALTPAAHAQSLGTVLTVPMSELGTIWRLNVVRQSNVSVIHQSQVAFGNHNVQVATVSVRQRNGAAAHLVWLPKRSLSFIRQLNSSTVIQEQAAFGDGNLQVAQVEVMQSNQSVSRGSRFLKVPLSTVGAIRFLNQKNFNVVDISQVAVGRDNTQVALVEVDQQNASRLKIPHNSLNVVLQLNVNVTVINQFALGRGNVQVAEVRVNQSNRG
jgi:predicted amino acid-binding ACT domain protein